MITAEQMQMVLTDCSSDESVAACKQLIAEHAAMKRALTWREQAMERAPETEEPTLAKRANGSNYIAYPGCAEPDWEYWLPVPTMVKP